MIRIFQFRDIFGGRSQKLHSAQWVLLALGFFLVGLSGGFLAKGGSQWVIDAFRLAYLNQYNVRANWTTGDTSYYVSTTNTDALSRILESEDGIVSITPTFIDGLLIIVISKDHPNLHNRLKQNDLVRVITTLPLLCH